MVCSGGTVITVLVFLVSCLAVSAADIVDSEYCEEKCEQGFKCVVTYNGGCFGKPRYGCIREEETCATKKCPENTECKMEEDCPFFSECTEKAICVAKATKNSEPKMFCDDEICDEGYECVTRLLDPNCCAPGRPCPIICQQVQVCLPEGNTCATKKCPEDTECEETRTCDSWFGCTEEAKCVVKETPKNCNYEKCDEGFECVELDECCKPGEPCPEQCPLTKCIPKVPLSPPRMTCADMQCPMDHTCIEPECSTGNGCLNEEPKCIEMEKPKDLCETMKCEEGFKCVVIFWDCIYGPCPEAAYSAECVRKELVNHSEFVDETDPCFGYVCPDGEVCRAEQETICPTFPPCIKSGPKIPKCVNAYDEKIEDQRAFSYGYGSK